MTAPARYNAGDQQRRAMIAKVKIAQKELRLDDPTYRAMLARITGKTSAADCNVAQLAAVLDELKAKGWKPTVITGGKAGVAPTSPTRSKPADHPAARKARALWISLHQLGVVRDRRESALESFAARQLKVERLQWANQGQVYKLIEALKAMAERAGWSQTVVGVSDPEAIAVVLRTRLEILLERRRQEAEAE